MPTTNHDPDALSTRVLVVDDDEALCEILGRLLEHLGYSVRCVHSASAALEVWEKEGGGISFVFTDVMMPGMDGLTLARMLRQSQPKVPILLLSGHLNDDSRWIVSEEGFCFLQKPFTLEELKGAMSMMVTRGQGSMD
ncbi:MAG: response regulator [Opitutaceae bacterium]|jgi:two-component system cell cycle sensor histidine kinase/response regulator CckA